MRRDGEGTTLTEHDYIGLSAVNAPGFICRGGMRKAHEGPIPDLNLGETELRLGPPQATHPSRDSALSVGRIERFSGALAEERQPLAACSEQISCRGEGLISGLKDTSAPDRPQMALKRGFSDVLCGQFAAKSSSGSPTAPADAGLHCSAADSEIKHMRGCFLPPTYPWTGTDSSTPMDVDQSRAPVQSFPSPISSAEQQQKHSSPGEAGVKDSGTKPWDLYSKRESTDADAEEISGEDIDNAPSSCSPVVGWPPVQSFRNKTLAAQPQSKLTHESQALPPPATPAGSASVDSFFVKVYMDGVTIGRKVDLNSSNSYEKLSFVLEDMFRRFMLGNGRAKTSISGSTALMKERKERSFLHGSDYVLTYEDKDGDLMLVGDVPWSMFICTVRRLRIMKGSDAIGLAPKGCEREKSKLKH